MSAPFPVRQDDSGGENRNSENTQQEQQRGTKRKSSSETASPNVSDGWGSTELELEKFSFTWSITNFAVIIADSKSAIVIPSPVFRGGAKSNHEWQLTLKRRAPKETIDSADLIAIYLRLLSFGDGNEHAERKIKVRFQFSVLDVITGVPVCRDGGLTDSAEEFSRGKCWGYSDFLDCKLLSGELAARLTQDDMIKIFCEVWIEGDFCQRTGASGSSQDLKKLAKHNRSELVSNFKNLLLDQKWADVAITTPTQTFMAHKAILSGRSSVFRAMLEAPMLESAENIINIMDFDERVVKGMLDYVYTGETSDLNAIAGDLLQIAEKYDLKGLKDMSELALSENLTVYNAVQVLVHADLHNAANLKANVLNFVKRNMKKVQNTEAFQDVVQSNKDLILEIFLPPV